MKSQKSKVKNQNPVEEPDYSEVKINTHLIHKGIPALKGHVYYTVTLAAHKMVYRLTRCVCRKGVNAETLAKYELSLKKEIYDHVYPPKSIAAEIKKMKIDEK